MATVTYYLCRNPSILKRVQDEVRSAFSTYEEIDGQSTSSLRYLQAVCLEALRVFPPLPLGLPRVVPDGGEWIDGHFVPEKVTRVPPPGPRHVAHYGNRPLCRQIRWPPV